MARLTDRQSGIAAERLRLVISRSKGGYNVNRKRFAKRLGVTERSLERYLQRGGTSRRRIRDSDMKKKIDRAFNYRKRDLKFLATVILSPGEFFDVTPYMAPTIGDDINSIMGEWLEGDRDRNPGSVWLKSSIMPRILFTGGARMGLGFGRIAFNVRENNMGAVGGFISDGELRDYSTPNEFASDTFGYVNDSKLGIKGRSSDLTVGIDRTIENVIEKVGSSVIYVLAVFDPKAGVEIYQDSLYETLGTTVRNRRPIVDRNADGKYIGVRWEERKR